MSLVAANDFEGLPTEPEARWLRLRDLLEERLDERFDVNNGNHETYDLLEYIQVLCAAAEELGIGALTDISQKNNVRSNFDNFRASVAALATRLSLRVSAQSSSQSVTLSRPTRKEILRNIDNLRSMISRSDLSGEKKLEASKIVDQLQILTVESKTDIARVGILLAALGAFAVGTTSLLADLPAAIGTISALIGADKREEEIEQSLIEESKKKLQIQDLRETPKDQSNDEIPF